MLRCESPLDLVKMQMLTPEAWDEAEVPHLYGAGLCGSCWCRCWSTARTHCSAECPAHAPRAGPPSAQRGLPVWGSELRPSRGTTPAPQTSCHRPGRVATCSPSCGRAWKVLASFTRNWCHFSSDWHKQDPRGKGNGDTAWSSISVWLVRSRGGPEGGRQSKKNMGFEVKPGLNPRLWPDRCVNPELVN